jgi:hypothetical protein
LAKNEKLDIQVSQEIKMKKGIKNRDKDEAFVIQW